MRCIRRALRLASALGIRAEQSQVAANDEGPEGERYAGFPYRGVPGIAAKHACASGPDSVM